MVGLLLAVVAAAVYAVWRWRTSGFDWNEFRGALLHVSWSWLTAGIILALGTYVGRALRWEVMLRPLRKDASLWRILTATAIGFTSVVLFGRAGEPVRPYLIAKKENVTFSSQVAAWILERILDLMMVLLIFGVALTQVSSSSMKPGPHARVALEAGGYTAGITGAASLALLIALRQFKGNMKDKVVGWLKFLPPKVLDKVREMLGSFEEGMESTRSAGMTVELIGYTVLEWMMIAGGFFCVFRAFPATERMGVADVVILLGFVAFGSVLQIPGVGGGMQIATVLVLTEMFGVGLGVATGIALVLWVISFVLIVPIGLAMAFHEGIHWRNLRDLKTDGSAD